jgi:hypothetical protein
MLAVSRTYRHLDAQVDALFVKLISSTLAATSESAVVAAADNLVALGTACLRTALVALMLHTAAATTTAAISATLDTTTGSATDLLHVSPALLQFVWWAQQRNNTSTAITTASSGCSSSDELQRWLQQPAVRCALACSFAEHSSSRLKVALQLECALTPQHPWASNSATSTARDAGTGTAEYGSSAWTQLLVKLCFEPTAAAKDSDNLYNDLYDSSALATLSALLCAEERVRAAAVEYYNTDPAAAAAAATMLVAAEAATDTALEQPAAKKRKPLGSCNVPRETAAVQQQESKLQGKRKRSTTAVPSVCGDSLLMSTLSVLRSRLAGSADAALQAQQLLHSFLAAAAAEDADAVLVAMAALDSLLPLLLQQRDEASSVCAARALLDKLCELLVTSFAVPLPLRAAQSVLRAAVLCSGSTGLDAVPSAVATVAQCWSEPLLAYALSSELTSCSSSSSSGNSAAAAAGMQRALKHIAVLAQLYRAAAVANSVSCAIEIASASGCVAIRAAIAALPRSAAQLIVRWLTLQAAAVTDSTVQWVCTVYSSDNLAVASAAAVFLQALIRAAVTAVAARSKTHLFSICIRCAAALLQSQPQLAAALNECYTVTQASGDGSAATAHDRVTAVSATAPIVVQVLLPVTAGCAGCASCDATQQPTADVTLTPLQDEDETCSSTSCVEWQRLLLQHYSVLLLLATDEYVAELGRLSRSVHTSISGMRCAPLQLLRCELERAAALDPAFQQYVQL